MRVGFMSDLHLEFRDRHPFMNKDNEEHYGDVLILAGDTVVAPYLQTYRNDANARSVRKLVDHLVTRLFKRYTYVFMIAGNHEHYNFIFPNTIKTMKDYFEHPNSNVKVFDNDFVDIGGVRFIGSTLWSDFHKASPVSMANVAMGMNDYRIIYRSDPMQMSYVERMKPSKSPFESCIITAEFILNEHSRSKQYIAEVAKLAPSDVFVFTHHAPTYKSSNRERYGTELEGGYCSDLSDLILDNPRIKYWVHGHTHYNVDYKVGDCRVISNQCGYASIFAGDQPWEQFTGPIHIEV